MNCVGRTIRHFLLTVVLAERFAIFNSVGGNSLPHLEVKDDLCPGDTMTLWWKYTATGKVIEIVWNYTELGAGKVPITIAKRLANNFVEPYKSKFAGRLGFFNNATANAGLQLFSARESDEGIFGVNVSLGNQNDLTDSVSVSFKAYMQNRVTADDKTVCTSVPFRAKLRWTVLGGGASQECRTPSSAVWLKDAKKLATFTAPSSFSVERSDLGFRLSNPAPLELIINPSKASDRGNYVVDAIFQQKYTVRSDAKQLLVKLAPEVLPLTSMVVCVNDSVSFPWQFRHGTSCNGNPTVIDEVTWTDYENAKLGWKDSKGNSFFYTDVKEGRVSSPSDPLQWLEIIVSKIKPFGKGSYEVAVKAHDDDGLKLTVTSTVYVTTEELRKPDFYRDRQPYHIVNCVKETVYLNWEYYFPHQEGCKPPNASSFLLFYQRIILYDSRKPNPNAGHISRYPGTNAGFMISNLDRSMAGTYSIQVTFPVVGIIHSFVELQVDDNPKLTEVTANSLCSDDKYHANWDLIMTRCRNPIKIAWYMTTYQDNMSYLVGYRATLEDDLFIFDKFKRHVLAGHSKVDIQFKDLWKLVPGDFPKKLQVQAKLLYPSTSSDILAYEVFNDVLIYDKHSDICTGVQIRDAKFYVTRNDEDVSENSNHTVAIGDDLKLSVTIPHSASDPDPRFFWQEMHHTEVRHNFKHKCPSATDCQMVWKISKRSIPINFLPSDDRKKITVGVKITYMSAKSTIFVKQLYIGNPLDVKTSFSKQKKGESWTIQNRKQLLLNLLMNALAVLLGSRLW